MSYSVYCHTNKTNGKKYIGITGQDVKIRWHGGHGYRKNPYFWNAIKKYGWDNFTHEVLATGLTKEKAGELEQKLIEEYQTTNRGYGYNISIGGEFGGLGVRRTLAQKKKFAQITKNLWKDEKYRTKVLERRKQYVFTQKHREHLSKSTQGREVTKETRAKISYALRHSEKFKANYVSWNKGKHYTQEQKEKYKSAWEYTSDETRKQISNSVKTLWEDEQYREHMRKAHLGKGIKKVICIELNKEFESLKKAQEETNIKYDCISRCCHGKTCTAGGYHWKFA